MRRDLCFYVEAPIDRVYNAYLTAATNQPFERECAQTPYHNISFGINFSFKYNMNGGGCNLHFMPSGTGTAVNMRFSIAQAAGARYERYANDLNAAMLKVLPVALYPANYDAEEFVKPQNQVTPAGFASAPVAAAPVALAKEPAARSQNAQSCSNCGHAMGAQDRFCSHCGTPASVEKCCPGCGSKIREGDRFCGVCGTRLQ